MGILDSGPEGPELGLEIAGHVRRVGKSVQNVAVGDRVVALAPHGCITTNCVLPAAVCVRIPAKMSFEEAATMPICFATAIKSLLELGQLEKGQVCINAPFFVYPVLGRFC
jgi:NADPH:quinone reductase-like Zn-dependent oxidoreductase